MDLFQRLYEFFSNRHHPEETVEKRLNIMEQRDVINAEGLDFEDVEDESDEGFEDNRIRTYPIRKITLEFLNTDNHWNPEFFVSINTMC